MSIEPVAARVAQALSTPPQLDDRKAAPSPAPSADALIGSPGDDHIEGYTGGDTIHAQDGRSDWITFGTRQLRPPHIRNFPRPVARVGACAREAASM
jgi:hypothetical protein